MKSPYESPENLVALDLFQAIFLAVTGMAMLCVSVWAIITARADATVFGMVAAALVAFSGSFYFFGQYREEKRAREERRKEKITTPERKE